MSTVPAQLAKPVEGKEMNYNITFMDFIHVLAQGIVLAACLVALMIGGMLL